METAVDGDRCLGKETELRPDFPEKAVDEV
jgi:hypothetical protein